MGLDTTHDGFHGAYSAFSRWRNDLAIAAGYRMEGESEWRQYPALNWDAITEANLMGEWESTPEDPLIVLIAHSDCDGEILPEQAAPLADRLEQLLPAMREKEAGAWGHITRDGGYEAVTQRFIDGLRLAASRGEPVGFR
jgi:hypothetical protein